MIRNQIELSLCASLTNAIVRAGDDADEGKDCSTASIARFHTVSDLTFKIVTASDGQSNHGRIGLKLLSLLQSLISQESINFGLLQLYGDSTFFELVNLVVMFCARGNYRQNHNKFPGRIIKFFASFVEFFHCEMLSFECWKCWNFFFCSLSIVRSTARNASE
jgi:hypothetical protein